MSLGEIFGGLAIKSYLKSTLKKRKTPIYFGVELIQTEMKLKLSDNDYKITFLIFIAAFFDFIHSIVDIFYIKKKLISSTLSSRLGCIYTIVCSLICKYSLKFKVGRHQRISIISLSICLIIMSILEFIYKKKAISLPSFSVNFIFTLFFKIILSFTNCIERYLVDANFLSPFSIIIIEGIFVLIMSIIYSICISKNPFE